jgi:transcriptional regulator with XRE-family HTH domain
MFYAKLRIMSERYRIEETSLEKFLAQEMTRRNISIITLARGAGISRQTLHSYLNGARPSLENCRKLAFFLGISLSQIVCLVYPNPEEKIIDALLGAYLDLPDEGQRVAEDVIFSLQRHMGKR